MAQVTQLEFSPDGRGLISNADLSPVLWDLSPTDLPAVDGPADALWETLASPDAAKAYPLQWALAKRPDAAVKLLQAKVNFADLAVPRAEFDKWIAALDSPQFRAREAAEKALTLGGPKIPATWLRTALAASKSDEARARLGRVLTLREKDPDPAAWRLGRAIQVLELTGTVEAKKLLGEWAADGSPLAADAKAALGRLGR